MQVIKDIEHSLLFAPVGLRGKWYISVAVLLFFKLDDPETAITEQELWPLIQMRLGSEVPLDTGFPKPKGEFLAAGRAFWPGLDSLNNSFRAYSTEAVSGRALARIKVGELTRTLAVFGPRHWQPGLGGLKPSLPQEITAVPLTWGMAYGGIAYADNPGGMGADILVSPTGEKYQPLPQVEDYHQLMGGPDDQPQPASFLPNPLARPGRKVLAGTYDDQWLTHRWPGFPDDLNPDFFSVAHTRQILPQGFFCGGEKVVVEGCHPEKYRQESFVPRSRVRLFITTFTGKKSVEIKFSEAETRLETVWLFPEDERGLVLHRSLIEVDDEEFSNVCTLFVQVEDFRDEVKDLNHYREEQQRRQAVSVPVDMSPFQKAADNVNDMLRQLRTLDQDVDMEVARHLGKAPRPRMSTDQVIDGNLANFKELKNMLSSHKKMLRSSKKEFGHLVPINVNMLNPVEEGLDHLGKKLSEQKKVLAGNRAKIVGSSQQILDKLQNKILPLLPPEVAQLPSPDFGETIGFGREQPWSREALKLLTFGGRQLASQDKRQHLVTLGIRPRDINSGLFGLLPEAVEVDPDRWGLNPADLPPNWPKTVGPGWLVPEFQGSRAVSLTVRPFDDLSPFTPGLAQDQDWLMPGSKPGVTLLGGGLGRPLILATDPFLAWFLYAEAGDQFMILNLSNPAAEISPEMQEALVSAPLALLPVPVAEQDDLPRLEPWLGILPKLQFFSFEKGTHLFESRANNFDIRGALLSYLPPIGLEIPPDYGVKIPQKPEDADQLSINVPKFDIGAMVTRSQAAVKAHVNSKMGSPQATLGKTKANILREIGEAKADRFLKPQGYSLAGILGQVDWDKPIPSPKPSGPSPKFLAKMDQVEQKLNKIGALSPKGKVKIDKLRQGHIELTEKTKDLHLKGMKRLEAAKAAAGVDINPPVVTVERVVELHQRGQTIDGLNLSNLDFSGLNLASIKLQQVFLNNTIFRGADLSGADFNMCSGHEIDFRETNLQGTKCTQSSLADSDFTLADLAGFTSVQGDFSGSLFQKTSLERANFDQGTFNNACFGSGCRLDKANFYMSTFSDSRLENLMAQGVSFSRSSFSGAKVKNCQFNSGKFVGTLFVESEVEDVVFEDGDLTNIRFNHNCRLENLIFRRSILDDSTFTKAEMAGTVFDNCRMKKAGFEECNLAGSRFIACQAPKAMIHKCDLKGAYMVALDIQEGSFRRSELVGTDLSYANCYATEFYKSVMTGTNLTGANLRLTLLESREKTAQQQGFTSEPS